jgi:hypothetical protein
MYVAMTTFSPRQDEEVQKFADAKTFREAFMQVTGTGRGGWRMEVLIDGGYETPETARFDVTNMGYLLYAKDKDTLRDGMKACPPAVKVLADRGQIGFFGGSYDFEQSGAWLESKMKGAKIWNRLKTEERSGTRDRVDVSRGRFDTIVNRQRLMERGYFLILCNSALLSGVKNARKMIGSEMSLSALGRMMAGQAPKMERQQALGVLMDSLNLG